MWSRSSTSSAVDDMGIALETSLDVSPLVIGGREFRSRLMVGTGKYASNSDMIRAIEASGAEVVTVAVRRVDLDRANEEGILNHLDPAQFFLLANTAGCYTAEDAIRYARLAQAAGFNEWVKLEVIGDQETLLPDTVGLLEATRTLAAPLAADGVGALRVQRVPRFVLVSDHRPVPHSFVHADRVGPAVQKVLRRMVDQNQGQRRGHFHRACWSN